MAEQAERRKADRRIVHCLVCHRPQENLLVHLARKCLKNSTPEQIASEFQKAKESSKQWMLRGRTWDYSQICALLPDPRSQQNLVGELLSRGFFVTDLPQESGAGGLAEEADDPSCLRENPSVDDPPSIEDCQQVLRVARPDFVRMQSDLQTGTELSDTDRTKYRYWCEVLLVFRHMQRPADVEALTDSEWLDRIAHGGRIVIGVRKHKNVSMQIALTQEEEAFLLLYFTRIRPGNIHLEKFNRNFFLSSSGERAHSVTRDMARFLEMYNLSPYTSQDMRRAVVRMATQKLSEHQQEAVRRYLNPTMVRPQDVVEAAVLLDSLVGSARDSEDNAVTVERGTCQTLWRPSV